MLARCKILNRDLKAAGIPKRDDRGRTVDVHALRHTFGTMLSKAGVSPSVAQAAMRHSSIDLTMNIYTDPRLLDVQGAVESLPHISTTAVPNENRQRIAVGTESLSPSSVAVPVAVPADFSRVLQSTAVTLAAFRPEANFADTLAATAMSGNEKRSLSLTDNERSKSGWRDLNPRPPAPQAGALARLRYSP